MLMLLAALASAPAPVTAAPATYDIDVRVSCASGVIEPHLAAEEGLPAAVTVDSAGRRGWSVKVTPTRVDTRVKLALDFQVWTQGEGGRRIRRATSDVVLPAGDPVEVVIPAGDGTPAFEAEISAAPS